ncbi:MAG: DUF177 domain-containing protein [Candidatus Aminicenantes bacterium]|nr:MAG: DUF177 domain-containing protein [Candidatus Aminicenantes bacterium]
MIIEIDKIPPEGLKISKDFEFFNADIIEESAVFLRSVHSELFIKGIGEEILIRGRIKTRLSFVCSRCLAPFEFPVDSKFDLVYLPEELDVFQDKLENGEINTFFYYSYKINVKEVVLEQLNLTFPLKPLCSENCQGICPVCGKIIKEGECACVRDDSDPRLEKLKTFMKDKR